MITEERLNELETEGRSATPMRGELQELATAYREHIPGMKVINDADGAWLHFTAPSGKKAAINIDILATERGPLVGAAVREWLATIPRETPREEYPDNGPTDPWKTSGPNA